MRIGLNLLGLRAGGIGGGSIYLEEMVRRLVADDQHEVTLFIASDPPSEIQELSRDVKVVQIGKGEYSERRRMLLELSALGREVGRQDLDILHTFGGYGVPIRGNRTKQIVTSYDLQDRHFPEYFTRSRQLKRRLAFAFGDRYVTRYLAISEFTKRDLVTLAGIQSSRIDVTPLGVELPDVASLRESAVLTTASWYGSPYIIYPATYFPHKNHLTLLDSMVIIRNEGVQPPTLVLTGMGTDDQKLRSEIISRGLAETVHTLGWLSRHDLYLAMARATLLVFPSRFEGFGLPLIEAMRLGVPAVGADAGSIPEVLGTAGVLFDPSSASQLAELIMRLMTNEHERNALSVRGLERSASFTWDSTYALTIRSYREVAQLA
jgi:alpha-1,3-rhamnosyl/mannosyltransferase